MGLNRFCVESQNYYLFDDTIRTTLFTYKHSIFRFSLVLNLKGKDVFHSDTGKLSDLLPHSLAAFSPSSVSRLCIVFFSRSKM